MSLIVDVVKELVSMFLADARLSIATLALVAVVAGLVATLHVGPLVGGSMLLIGCLVILVEAAAREARRPRAS